MKMSVPGDAGYEVEKFTEKKCETCIGQCVDRQNAATCKDWYPKIPKPASPIGETVLTQVEFLEVLPKYRDLILAERKKRDLGDTGVYCVVQDAHTRSELVKQGWKSPEEIQELITKVSNASNREGHTDQERLMKECGWKSPEEIQKSFNPESLNYKKGVIDGRLFESREVAKELKKITVYPDSDAVFDDRVVIGREEYDALIRRLEGK
jgi:hypothetical protein